MMDIKAIAAQMVREGYFIVHKERYVVTEKFNKEVRGVEEGLTKLPGGKLKVVERERSRPGLTPEEWRGLYMKFISDCKIPAMVQGGDGAMYAVNKFSEPGLKEFRKIIEQEAVDLDKLVAITTLYYADRRKKPKTITNYITEGIWRTSYGQAPEKLTKKEGGWDVG